MKKVAFDKLTKKVSKKDNLSRSVFYKKYYYVVLNARVLAFNAASNNQTYYEIRKLVDTLNDGRFKFNASYYKKSELVIDKL